MLRKKEVFTIITPIPGFIPRQLAIDILHSHSEVITLNPLVLEHKPIKAPRDAASDEFYSTWYEITERIQYIPGLGRMGSGKISFNGCFHDMPWGLQTHIYAPMNVDLRNKYRIAGNQPGVEPPEQPEIGLAALGAPSDGLYLREDIEIKCNLAVVGFVKTQLKAASKEMVSRIIKKAELLDAGVLHAMIEDGRLKTINPADRTNTGLASPQLSPRPVFQQQQQPGSPGLPPNNIPYQVPRPMSHQYYAKPGTPTQLQQQRHSPRFSAPYGQAPPPQQQQQQQQPQHAELSGLASPQPQNLSSIPVEMPGDFYYQPQSSPRLPPPQPSPTFTSDRDSTASWSQQSQSQLSQSSRPTSVASDTTSTGFHSPALDHQGFASELPTHKETPEEHSSQYRAEALQKLDPRASQQQQQQQQGGPYAYNPADYAKLGGRGHLPSQQGGRYGYAQ
ncbi:NACHT and WD40 domain protein [Pleurostoma richardsiae]|uniref:NACHT and WD40 domain protein n=1 Tax=Pleurostoma richardsiae TaxID=41990 RepID=A0AA38RH48_9PEZI|nr:NACHT and WD40 domain protein [Pleurostoma richardsiae]